MPGNNGTIKLIGGIGAAILGLLCSIALSYGVITIPAELRRVSDAAIKLEVLVKDHERRLGTLEHIHFESPDDHPATRMTGKK